ncbi:MAG: hypothetical protein PHR26_01350 [Candidatus ainarchaeum sp.]|nr:hypothetical protein [Candidatus ainarchaeum sp.]MDD3976284.1 hypothetical protein [Candidatus ainarchaeum sp.]
MKYNYIVFIIVFFVLTLSLFYFSEGNFFKKNYDLEESYSISNLKELDVRVYSTIISSINLLNNQNNFKKLN